MPEKQRPGAQSFELLKALGDIEAQNAKINRGRKPNDSWAKERHPAEPLRPRLAPGYTEDAGKPRRAR